MRPTDCPECAAACPPPQVGTGQNVPYSPPPPKASHYSSLQRSLGLKSWTLPPATGQSRFLLVRREARSPAQIPTHPGDMTVKPRDPPPSAGCPTDRERPCPHAEEEAKQRTGLYLVGMSATERAGGRFSDLPGTSTLKPLRAPCRREGFSLSARGQVGVTPSLRGWIFHTTPTYAPSVDQPADPCVCMLVLSPTHRHFVYESNVSFHLTEARLEEFASKRHCIEAHISATRLVGHNQRQPGGIRQ